MTRCSVTVPTIAIAPNITQYFQEVISDAIRARKVEATDAAASYLVENSAQLPEDLRDVVGTLHRNARLEAQLRAGAGDLDVVVDDERELAALALDLEGLALEVDGDALRDDDRVLADARHG